MCELELTSLPYCIHALHSDKCVCRDTWDGNLHRCNKIYSKHRSSRAVGETVHVSASLFEELAFNGKIFKHDDTLVLFLDHKNAFRCLNGSLWYRKQRVLRNQMLMLMCFHTKGIINLLRIPFFWDMMQPHWVIAYRIQFSMTKLRVCERQTSPVAWKRLQVVYFVTVVNVSFCRYEFSSIVS
jgi:hypothetical protein